MCSVPPFHLSTVSFWSVLSMQIHSVGTHVRTQNIKYEDGLSLKKKHSRTDTAPPKFKLNRWIDRWIYRSALDVGINMQSRVSPFSFPCKLSVFIITGQYILCFCYQDIIVIGKCPYWKITISENILLRKV